MAGPYRSGLSQCVEVARRLTWMSVIAAAFGVASDRAAAQGTGAVVGAVVDESGDVVANVTVALEDGSAITSTGGDGRFRLAGVAAGEHVVVVEADGYAGLRRTVRVVDGSEAELELRLVRTAFAIDPIEVLVRGAPDGSSVAGKLPLSPRESVQSVETVARATLDARAVTSIREATATATGVQPIPGYGGMEAAGIISRGFPNDWVLRNGFRLFRHGVPVDPVIFERLEVLKGPAGLLAGQTDPGGTMNMVSKRPVRERFLEFASTAGSDGLYRNTLDVGGAVADALLTRLTAAHESGDSHRDTIEQDKLFVAPQVQWQLAPRTFLGVELNYHRNRFEFERGLPASPLSLEVPLSRVIRDPRYPRSRALNFAVFQSLTHGLGPNWTVTQRLGAMFNENRIRATYPGGPNEAGDIPVNLTYSDEDNENVTVQVELQGTWRVAGRVQRTVIGAEYSQYLFGYTFFDGDGTYSPAGMVNLFEPRYDYPSPALETPVFGSEYGSKAVSVYLEHQAELSGRVKLLAGGRLDRAEGFSFNRLAGTDVYPDKIDLRFSPRVGIVATPADPTDVFASYATSFKPNVFGTNAEGEAFDAELGEQIEAGVRHEFIPGRFRGQIAVFHIEKENVVVYEPPDFTAGHTGTRESNGVELEVVGSPVEGWTLTGGYAYLDAEITRDTNPANIGAALFGVPPHQSHLWTEYEFGGGPARGLSLGYGVFYADERPANEPATLDLPAYTRHDLMVRYGRGPLSAQLNIDNLTDTRIYESHSSLIYPRAGIAVRGSLRVML